ncbi:P-loop containing nucleoside triphosphate hydrolase protein [Chytriomyces sp. MP71]|nr:P-loop containing nucleoside triphosphate hydrolase protein [Chytriomyces sp. MP71]
MKELGSERARGVELDAKLRDEESVRRRLHNEIQELKGNIRVFCRIRPLLGTPISYLSFGLLNSCPQIENEQDSAPLTHIKLNPADDKSLELVATAAAETVRDVQSSTTAVAKSYPFSFDKIFPAHASQAHVFEEIAQLVQSALDGYNVCIFAYGQTGSGKTFTMEGGKTPEQMGVIPRAVSQIFAASALLAQKGWSYTFEASFLEIYNETIRDLLLVTNGGKAGNTTQQLAKYEIKHEGGLTRVTDLTVCPVSTGDEVHALLRRASANRAVAATNSNEHSSRSHSVFTLRLAGLNALTKERCAGTLNLIDLAGSERLSASGSTGERLKETQAINKSLSALGDVIFALGNKEGHVPYRNSKLTYLLQNSLGGNSKTLMFVNVSPLAASFGESLCSLRFATKVNSCQIGTAKALKK